MKLLFLLLPTLPIMLWGYAAKHDNSKEYYEMDGK